MSSVVKTIASPFKAVGKIGAKLVGGAVKAIGGVAGAVLKPVAKVLGVGPKPAPKQSVVGNLVQSLPQYTYQAPKIKIQQPVWQQPTMGQTIIKETATRAGGLLRGGRGRAGGGNGDEAVLRRTAGNFAKRKLGG